MYCYLKLITFVIIICKYQFDNPAKFSTIKTWPYNKILTIFIGETELSGFVYIPELDKVLKPFDVDRKDNSGAEIHCQSLNGTLLMITSLERQIYIEKMLRGMSWSHTCIYKGNMQNEMKHVNFTLDMCHYRYCILIIFKLLFVIDLFTPAEPR